MSLNSQFVVGTCEPELHPMLLFSSLAILQTSIHTHPHDIRSYMSFSCSQGYEGDRVRETAHILQDWRDMGKDLSAKNIYCLRLLQF